MELIASLNKESLNEAEAKVPAVNYDLLYNRYAKAMYNTSLRIVNNSFDAEDILQESFLEAFKGLEGFQSRSTFGAWLKRIVINRSINKVKRNRFSWVEIENSAFDYVPEEEKIDENEFEYRVEEIKRGILKLSYGYRTVLCLRLFEDCQFDEIAELLKMSPSTARTQFMRGKQKLLEIIKSERNEIKS